MRQSGLLTVVFMLGAVAISKAEAEDVNPPATLFLYKRVPISSENVYLADSETLNALLSGIHTKRGLPVSITDDKRAIPMSGGIYGKRSAPPDPEYKRASLPFSGGIYGKRAAMNIPFSGGIYGKRSIAVRSLPLSGGIYG
ncbi:hypothetical protein FO519_004021 [Halicephalobus sp. NKZ332]|nr:hypothetical protein FO519_004021 [Halicephalobus sp. NKZ332]